MKTNWYSMVSQIQAHRNNPVPIEYILGGAFFCGEWFIVNSSVLIPRQETETLVKYVMEKTNTSKILDLGTGCGNIAVILAKRLGCKVYAVDISENALEIAKKNAKIHRVEDKIKFCKSDWYSELNIEPVDIIVSNPPYIAEEEWDFLPIEVKNYEPKIALWGGRDGLEHYRKIISGAKNMLVSGGKIVMEIGYNQAEAVKNLLKDFEAVEIIKDSFSNTRVVSAIY